MMKTSLLMVLLFSQTSWAGPLRIANDIINFIQDYRTPPVEDLCVKLTDYDQEKDCKSMAKTEGFRKDLLRICFDVQKKWGSNQAYSCLQDIVNKKISYGSPAQMAVCQKLFQSNSFSFVERCLKTDVNESLSSLCTRYSNVGQYKSALNCLETFDGIELSKIESSDINASCNYIHDLSSFTPMKNCIQNAESKINAGKDSQIQRKYNESISRGVQ